MAASLHNLRTEFYWIFCCGTFCFGLDFQKKRWRVGLKESTPRDGTLVGYIFSKRYKKVSPHRKSHNLLYNLLREKNKPPQEMVNKRGVPIGPTWLIRTLGRQHSTAALITLPSNILENRRRVMKKNVAILADSLPLSTSRHNTMFLKNWQHLL